MLTKEEIEKLADALIARMEERWGGKVKAQEVAEVLEGEVEEEREIRIEIRIKEKRKVKGRVAAQQIRTDDWPLMLSKIVPDMLGLEMKFGQAIAPSAREKRSRWIKEAGEN
jgi:hypothetical protein